MVHKIYRIPFQLFHCGFCLNEHLTEDKCLFFYVLSIAVFIGQEETEHQSVSFHVYSPLADISTHWRIQPPVLGEAKNCQSGFFPCNVQPLSHYFAQPGARLTEL